MPNGQPQEVPDVVTLYCPQLDELQSPRRWSFINGAQLHHSLAAPCRIAITFVGDVVHSNTRRTIAAHCEAPPFYMAASSTSSMAVAAPIVFVEPEILLPSPPWAPWLHGRPTAAAAVNARPGLRCIIKTKACPDRDDRPTTAAAINARPGLRCIIKIGHVPIETSASWSPALLHGSG